MVVAGESQILVIPELNRPLHPGDVPGIPISCCADPFYIIISSFFGSSYCTSELKMLTQGAREEVQIPLNAAEEGLDPGLLPSHVNALLLYYWLFSWLAHTFKLGLRFLCSRESSSR